MVGAIGIAVCLISVSVTRDDPSLLSHAAKVADIGPVYPDQNIYFWISGTKAIWLRDHFDSNGHKIVEAVEIDSKTHNKTPLARLKQSISSESNRNNIRLCRMSPDGKWLLFSVRTRTRSEWKLFGVDGSLHGLWPCTGDLTELTHALWLPDSKGWVEVAEQKSKADIVTHGLNGPGAIPVIQNFMPSYYYHLGFMGPNRCFAVTPRVGDGDVTVMEYDAPHVVGPPRIFFLKTPDGVTGSLEAALSPNGNRVAWLFGYRTGPLGLSILGRLPKYRYARSTIVGLWISDTNGGGMRLLGNLDTDKGSPDVLRWTPDGKRISFICQDAIWTVPAD